MTSNRSSRISPVRALRGTGAAKRAPALDSDTEVARAARPGAPPESITPREHSPGHAVRPPAHRWR